MITKKESSEWLESSARYLREKDLRDRLNNRPTTKSLNGHPDKAACYDTFADFVGKLETIERDLGAAVHRLAKLDELFMVGIRRPGHTFETSRNQPFENQANRIHAAYENAQKSLTEIQCARIEVNEEHPPATRELALQKSATKLAFGQFAVSDSRRVRAEAKRLMEKIGLQTISLDGDPMPSPATLTAWLKEFRREGAANAK